MDEIWERGKTRKKQESRDSKNQGHYELSLLTIIRDCANELSKSLFSCLIKLENGAEKAEQITALKCIICIFSKKNPEFWTILGWNADCDHSIYTVNVWHNFTEGIKEREKKR